MKERMDWMNIARYFYLTDERLQPIFPVILLPI